MDNDEKKLLQEIKNELIEMREVLDEVNRKAANGDYTYREED
ncbi:hypothetical protein [Clostridium rectalis]|nr:hypothetical protein [Clostridium rectalis]